MYPDWHTHSSLGDPDRRSVRLKMGGGGLTDVLFMLWCPLLEASLRTPLEPFSESERVCSGLGLRDG